MSRARFPAAAASRAVLIGVSRYESAALPPLPAVRTNLSDLRAALTDPTTGTLNRSGCRTLGDNATPAEVGRALAEASREASDLLLVYYAGHGVLDEDGTLHLALRTTSEDHPGWTALPITLVKRELARARARARVLVVDSCFSGQAIEAMAAPAGLVAGQLRLTGTYTLTSVPANEPSKAPIGARHTAFTGALLDALASPEPLTLDEIYRHTDETLAGLGLPRPQRGAVNSASDLALVRGPLARLKAVGAGADLAAAPLPGRTPDVVVPAPYPEPTPGTAAPRPNQPEAAPAPQPEPTPSPATPHANQPEAAPAPQPEPTPSPATPRPNQPEAAPAPQPEPTPSPATPRPNQPEAAPAPRLEPPPSPAAASEPAPGPRTAALPPRSTPSATPEPGSTFALGSGGVTAVAKVVLRVVASVVAAVLSWISFTDPFRNAGPDLWEIVVGVVFGLFFAVVAVAAAVAAIAGLRTMSGGWSAVEVTRAGIVLLGPGRRHALPWPQIERLTQRATEPPTVVLTVRPDAVLPAGVKARNGRLVLGRCGQWPALSAAVRRVAPASVAVDRQVRKLPR